MSATQQTKIGSGDGSPAADFDVLAEAQDGFETKPLRPRWWKNKKTLVLLVLGAVFATMLLSALALSVGDLQSTDQQLIYYTASRGDLPITVVERGNLDSQEKVEIFCELENLSYDRSGSSGTQILYIIPNGESVKKARCWWSSTPPRCKIVWTRKCWRSSDRGPRNSRRTPGTRTKSPRT